MTESGFEMPPDHIVFQMLSTLDLSAPVTMTSRPLFQFCLFSSLRRSTLRSLHSCNNAPSRQKRLGHTVTNHRTVRGPTAVCGTGAQRGESGSSTPPIRPPSSSIGSRDRTEAEPCLPAPTPKSRNDPGLHRVPAPRSAPSGGAVTDHFIPASFPSGQLPCSPFPSAISASSFPTPLPIRSRITGQLRRVVLATAFVSPRNTRPLLVAVDVSREVVVVARNLGQSPSSVGLVHAPRKLWSECRLHRRPANLVALQQKGQARCPS